MTAQELLTQLNTLDEHARIEAKSSSHLGRSALETVCAFANEPGLGGGWLLLGVEAAPNTLWPMFEAVSLKDIDKITADLVSQCSSAFSQPVRVQIEPFVLDRRRVLQVFVPEFPATQKPLYFKNLGLPRVPFAARDLPTSIAPRMISPSSTTIGAARPSTPRRFRAASSLTLIRRQSPSTEPSALR